MRNVRSLYQRRPDAAEQSGSRSRRSGRSRRSRSTLEGEREEEREEEREREEEEEEEEAAGGSASSGSSGVWLRGPSTLPRRPIPRERRPLIQPTGAR